jgi:molecular chaperone GrpE
VDERLPEDLERGRPDLVAQPGADDQQSLLVAHLDALRETVAALEKQIGRAGREQFKANVLAETQAQQLATALEALRVAEERREGELAAARERSLVAQAEARLEIIRAILPAIDGLDEALRSGQQVLARYGQWSGDGRSGFEEGNRDQPEGRSSIFGRLRAQLARPQPADATRREAAALHTALDAWLTGLDFVRRRLLDALAAQGVVPMRAEGASFDPRRHIALESVPAVQIAPGTVAQEIRRGYLAGDRVLRHAEVAVATDSEKGEFEGVAPQK